MKNLLGLNPIDVEGSDYSAIGVGYSKFVKMGNKFPLLVGKVNSFGIINHKDRIKKNIFGRIDEEKEHLSLYGKTSNIKVKGFLAGVTTLIIGEDIWGPATGFELGQVKKYKKIKTSTNWDFKIKKGHADCIYDIWINKNRKGKCIPSDVEIMVWLDGNFEPPWKEIGEFKDFRVKMEKKIKKSHPHDPGITFAFFPKKRIGKLYFDYKELIDFCAKYLKKDLKNHWIRSIYLGTEFAKNTEVEVKINKAKIDFV